MLFSVRDSLPFVWKIGKNCKAAKENEMKEKNCVERKNYVQNKKKIGINILYLSLLVFDAIFSRSFGSFSFLLISVR